MCQDFLKGYCPAGSDCKKKHQETVVKRAKKVPPAKPKRTSIVIPQDDEVRATPAAPPTPGLAARVPRYYENVQEEECTTAADQGEEIAATSSPGKNQTFE